MWPFGARNAQRTPSEPPQINPDQHLSARVAELEAQLSQLNGIRLEWAEMLDKLNRWSSRQAARERRRVVADLDQLGGDGSEIAEDAPQATNGGPPVVDTAAARMAAKAALRARIRR